MTEDRFETWPAILAYALDVLEGIPEGHTLEDVRFGTFDPSVDRLGGTHFVVLRAGYYLGNTIDARNPRPQTLNERRLLVIEAWERAAHPPRDPQENAAPWTKYNNGHGQEAPSQIRAARHDLTGHLAKVLQVDDGQE